MTEPTHAQNDTGMKPDCVICWTVRRDRDINERAACDFFNSIFIQQIAVIIWNFKSLMIDILGDKILKKKKN